MAGKGHNLDPMWKRLMTQIVLAKSTQFLDQVDSGCTQRECKPNAKSLVDECRQMFDSLSPQELLKNCLVRREVNANIEAWSYDMERHAEKMHRTVLRIDKQKIWSSCAESPHLLSMITSSNRKSWRQWEKCRKFALEST